MGDMTLSNPIRGHTYGRPTFGFGNEAVEVRQAMGDESHCWSFNLERLPLTMTMMFEVQDLKATRKGVCIYTYTYRIFIIIYTHITCIYILYIYYIH